MPCGTTQLLRAVWPVMLLLSGCAGVRPMPLSQPTFHDAEGLRVEVTKVSPSRSMLAQHGGLSVIATTVAAYNGSNTTRVLYVDRAVLSMRDPAGALAPLDLVASSGGDGPAPDAVPFYERVAPLAIPPGGRAVVWIAFRTKERLVEPDIPRRIVLSIPEAGEIVLADPSTARPRWVDAPVRHASYGGVHAAGTFDETSIGLLRASSKNVAGSFVLGPSFALGFRAGDVRGEPQRTIVCCDLHVAFDASAQLLRGHDNSLGPYFGYQSIFAVGGGRTDRATWHGPAIGLQFFSNVIEPRRAGAFPVRTTPSILGHSAFTIAYVHWLRRGDDGGVPGFMMMLEHATPDW